MGLCMSKEAVKNKAMFKDLDSDNSHTISKDEMSTFIEKHAELWAMLGVNLGIGEDKCREIATNVAYSLACDSKSDNTTSLSENQFLNFTTNYVNSPKGQQEFFHRTVFATFDVDGDNTLDTKELDRFLDTFYEAGSIFKGDKRLPEKEVLRQIVNDRLDKDGDGKLSFDEIHMLISGSADLSPLV
mmetsp:Transcript_19733/g.23492  ORF Transcript_19733/g.23492 Transcript_19733/m.23492 type:complete len:186 (-) Transcript_19733:163-720(-)